MKFAITRTNLQNELGLLQGVVERKNTIPVLANVLIETVGNSSIRLTGTDLDVTLRAEAEPEEIDMQGRVCVPGRKLFDIARLLPDETVNFTKEQNEWVVIECGKARFRVPGLDAGTFPEPPKLSETPHKLPAKILKLLVDRTIYAITEEEGRYTLSGAQMELNDKGLTMITTDGHRLALATAPDVKAEGTASALIPRKTLSTLVKLIGEFDGDTVNFGQTENHVHFQVGDRILTSRLLSGQFPNYEMVIPKNNENSITFDRAVLLRALKRVTLMADDRSRAIKFAAGKELTLSATNTEAGEANETIPVSYDGDPVEIGFNSQYLQDFLNVVESERILFTFRDGNAQALLHPDTEKKNDYLYVVMPMRL